MAPKSSICNTNDPVTYTPTALEVCITNQSMSIVRSIEMKIIRFSLLTQVPSFKVIDKDYIENENVPKDFFEDVTIEAAKERHLRFEIGERKRKK